MKGARRWGWVLAGAIGAGALAAAWRFTSLSELFSPQRVLEWAQVVRETPWSPLVLVALYTPAAFLMFPRPVLTILAVLAYGRWLGFAYAMTGILLSAIAAFYAGRQMPARVMQRLAGRHLEPVRRVLDRHGFSAVFLMRVLPTAPHAVASALAGALRVKLWQFAAATFLGMLPGVLVATVFGGEVASALEDLSKINYWVLGAALVASGAAVWMLRRWAKRQ